MTIRTAFIFLFAFLPSALFGQTAVRPITVSEELIKVDDVGSERAQLGFPINFFGITYDSVWVNNNGNLTFNAALSTFTPYLIQLNSLPMFAAFFADVDSRFYGNVTKYGKGTLEIAPGKVRNIFCVNWFDVGFYHGSTAPSDLTILNTFQMIIIDRSDIAPGDFDLEYNYNKVKWEAGTASGSDESGLGGTTVSMGWSNGTTAYYSHSGSLEPGAFLDAGPKSLIHHRLNSSVDGRYIFFVRNGVVVDLIGPQTFSIREMASPLDFVGRVNTTSFYSRDSITFSIVPPVLSEFTLATDTSGVIRVGPGIHLDYETTNHYTFNAIARFQGHDTVFEDTAQMTINIINVEPEQFLRDTVFAISELATSGALVGTIQAPLVPNPRFSLVGVSSDFILDSLGNLTVSPTAHLDFETKPHYLLTVIGHYVNIPNTLYDTAVITVNLINVSLGDLISNQNFTLQEKSSPGTAVGTIALNVSPAIVTLSVLGSLPPEFILDLATRKLVVAPGATFDYATTPVYTFKLLATALEATDDTALISISIIRNRLPQIRAITDTTIREKDILRLLITVTDSDGTIPRIGNGSPLPTGCSVVDSGNGKALLSWNTGCNDHGVYTIQIKASDCIDTVALPIVITITDVNFPPVFLDPHVNQSAKQLTSFMYKAHAEDCDGPPQLRVINIPSGATFTDNGDGTGTLLWTPQANQAGYYMVIFEAKDDATAVRDTIIIVVEDAARFAPTITVSSLDTTVGINLPMTLFVRATSKNGTIPLLSATSLPSGAKFVCDDNGNGVFSWTPHTDGKDSLTILARNVADSTLQTRCTVKITVENKNFTGPVFLPHNDTVIDQKTELKVTVEARDPDGSIPELYSVSAPPGVSFTDNGNGTGTFSWKPGCDVSGNFTLRAGATDHYLADSISVGIDVHVVNFPPVFAPMPNISAIAGEMVRIIVSAADQCIGSTIPMLSVSCELTGYTFETHGDGTGVFGWKAAGVSGSYPVIFYATNGFATASDTVILSINKSGSLIVKAQPKGAKIHVLPSANYSGTLLGTDSICYWAKTGTYWFEVEAAGFRSTRAAYEIKADSVITENVVLKPAIPLMIATPDSFIADTALSASSAGNFTLIDVNGDGQLDLSFISGQNIKTCYQFNNGTDSGFRSLSIDTAKRCEPIVNAVSHVFSDWNNAGVYSCIVATSAGKILLLKPTKGILTVAETLCTVSGSKPYPMVVDVDRDGKKDLVVHSENVGVFVFPNTGSDSMPKLGAAREVKDSSGASLTDFKGPVLLMDIDQNGSCKWVIASNGVLKMFAMDSSLSKLTYESDLNCGGSRFATDSARYALIGSPFGEPKIATIKGKVVKIFPTRLCGDINGDGVVDIRDISRISKLWEFTDKEATWVPLCNLKLSGGEPEVIDIRDISRASKCWELKE